MKNLKNLVITIILGAIVYFLGYHWVANLGMLLMLVASLIISVPIYIRGKRIVKSRKLLGSLMIIFSIISFVTVGIFIVTTLLGILKVGI